MIACMSYAESATEIPVHATHSKIITVKPVMKGPLMRDRPASGAHLLLAAVLFDVVTYTSNKRPFLLKDHFLVAFWVVSPGRFYCTRYLAQLPLLFRVGFKEVRLITEHDLLFILLTPLYECCHAVQLRCMLRHDEAHCVLVAFSMIKQQ